MYPDSLEEVEVQDGEPMTRIVRSLRGGQITIPVQFRKELGIEGDSLLQMTLTEGELRIKPLTVSEHKAGSPWLRELYERFAPVREQAQELSEQEIDQAIDDAVRDVRRSHA
jgi:bifunctional DNA-binding transcriptional regulator/antitoxin component of YhaV-PrlF toxin-antitoxin module